MKKVKKFGAGDLVTGIGAVLLGKALYDKYKGKDDDEKEPEAVGGASRRPKTIEEQIGRKAEPKERSAEEKRALATSKGRPELFPEGTTDADKATMYSDNYPTPKPKPAPKPAAKDVKVKPASQTFPVDNDALNRRRLEGLSKSKPATSDTSTSGVGPKNTFLTKERLDKAQDSMRRYREEQKKKQKGVTDVEYDPMGNPVMKKGGKVKKYASGGTVKSSASKRADGIAQRGKTRGRIC